MRCAYLYMYMHFQREVFGQGSGADVCMIFNSKCDIYPGLKLGTIGKPCYVALIFPLMTLYPQDRNRRCILLWSTHWM